MRGREQRRVPGWMMGGSVVIGSWLPGKAWVRRKRREEKVARRRRDWYRG